MKKSSNSLAAILLTAFLFTNLFAQPSRTSLPVRPKTSDETANVKTAKTITTEKIERDVAEDGAQRAAALEDVDERVRVAVDPTLLVANGWSGLLSASTGDIALYARLEFSGTPAADGVLLVSPEHNASVSALLKNAVDWASRPQGAIQGKPVALAGSTPGGFGTLRGQIAWRQTLANLGVPLLASPALLVSGAGEKFDADGTLTHQQTRDDLVALLVAFATWIERLRA